MAGTNFENLISKITEGRFQRLPPHGTYLGEYIVNFKKEATDAQKKASLTALLKKIFAHDYKDGKETIRIEFEWFSGNKAKTKHILRAYRVARAIPPKPKAQPKAAAKSRSRAATSDDSGLLAGDPSNRNRVAGTEPTGPILTPPGDTAVLNRLATTEPTGPILTPPSSSVSTVQTNTLEPVTDTIDE